VERDAGRDAGRRGRHRALFLFVPILAAFIVVGCGGPETVEQPPRAVPEGREGPVSQVGQGGTVEVFLPARYAEPPACSNPYLPECLGAEAFVGVVHEGPLVRGTGGEYVPLLAEEVPSFAGGTLRLNPFTVEYRLRSGARFADGRPVTSADARGTYEEAARLAREVGAGSVPYPGFARLESVETPDQRTVRLRFREPYAGWRAMLSAPILPREDGPPSETPTGTGPFVPVDRSEDALTFAENRRYWVPEPPLPNLDGLVVRYGEPPTGNDADLTRFSPLAPGADARPDARAARSAPARVEVLLPNARRPVFDDREAREAVARAVGPARRRLATPVRAPVADSFVPSASAGYVPAWRNPVDGASPQGSTGGGFPTDGLDVVYPDGPGREEVAAELVRTLESSGMRAEARAVPDAEFFGETLPRGDFDLALFALDSPEEHERLLPNLPPRSGQALSGAISAVVEREHEEALREVQRVAAEESALVPLFAWPDAYQWSGALSGPRPDAPPDAPLWNVREWGLYR
jgi:ABC-type transport system substrate-binding protein